MEGKNGSTALVSEKKLLRVSDVALAISVSRSQAYLMVAAGILPSIKIGARGIRIPAYLLDEWIRREVEGGGGNIEQARS